MVQQTGETRDAIIEDDNKLIQQIVDANKHLTDKYWIMVFAKPTRNTINGKAVLGKFIQAFKQKPPSMVGVVLGTVDNSTGTIQWEVNMPDVPFNYDGLLSLGAEYGQETVVETTTIPYAYHTK